MRAADVVTSVVFILLGVLVAWDSLRLGIGWGLEGPKSGFFPFWMAVIMIAASAVIVIQASRRADTKPFVTRESLGRVLKVLLPATALVLLTQFIGLYVASALYLALNMRWIGRCSWLAIAVVSIGFAVITFLVFETWFLVPMPKGPLESRLGY